MTNAGETVHRKRLRRHSLLFARVSLVFACAVSASCRVLEDEQTSVGPVTALAALDSQAAFTLQPGGSATLAVQALDAKGAPVDGVTVVFIRSEPILIDFDGIDAAAGTHSALTAPGSAFGLQTAGIAQATIRVRAGASAATTEVFGVVTPAIGSDAGASNLVTRFVVTVEPPPQLDGGPG